ncbi:MAG: Gfo/Idh/MocA family oxidoreductase [Bryobacteraceae bacterium]|nr:Gfo/Idh/MocA family oxidoreductase [Bryobacteraceae bacterium]MDW8378879.1 Gfo/Idh/MocA family oxidoreductase [Bryobacterales bacterium]
MFFLQAGNAATAAVTIGAVAASDTVRVAILGVRGRGRSIGLTLASLSGVQLAALCDVDDACYALAANAIEATLGRRPPHVKDLRRCLDDRSVDAVVIATPDHWHVPAALLALKAGKDVYVEKPLSHNLREGRMLVEATRKSKRMVQVGMQSRSRPSTQRAVEVARSGKIGRVLMAKAWNVQLRKNIGRKPDSPPPPGVDFDTWTGPALLLPFNENRYHYNWHWHWNYGTGDMGNDGVHQLDIARWALGVEHPQRVTGVGRKLFFDDDQQTPDTMNINFEFQDKMLLFEMRIWNPYGLEGQENGVAIYGTDGVVQIGRWTGPWGYRVYDAKGKLVEDHTQGGDGPDDHHLRNFLNCVRRREQPNASVETGHLSASLCHLGNIVARTGRPVRFDPATETILGDAEAHSLLGRQYRAHWSTPVAEGV